MSTPVPAQRLRSLNSGSAAATHLAECLAVDFAALLQVVAPALEPEALQCMRDASGRASPSAWRWRRGCQAHVSDTVRGWACYLIGSDAGATLPAKLRAMRPLADDPHFGVREWAWLALRADIVAAPCRAGVPAAMDAGSIAVPAPLRLRSAAPAACGPRISRCSSGTRNMHCRCWKHWPTTRSATCRTPWATGSTTPARRSRSGCVRCARWQYEHHSDANAYIRKRALRSLR